MNLLLAEGSNDKGLEFPTTRGFHPEVGAGFQSKHFPLLEDSQVAHDALLVFGVVVLVRTVNGERERFPMMRLPPQDPSLPAFKPIDSIRTSCWKRRAMPCPASTRSDPDPGIPTPPESMDAFPPFAKRFMTMGAGEGMGWVQSKITLFFGVRGTKRCPPALR